MVDEQTPTASGSSPVPESAPVTGEGRRPPAPATSSIVAKMQQLRQMQQMVDQKSPTATGELQIPIAAAGSPEPPKLPRALVQQLSPGSVAADGDEVCV